VRASILLVLTSIALVVFSAQSQAANLPSDCDRTCLKTTLDSYLAAVLKHDPSLAPLDPAFRYTENSTLTARGEGVWKTATALGKVQRRYFDAVTGQAVYFGHIEEGSATGIATVRIRVVNRKITEGEVVIGRPVDGTFNSEGLVKNPPPVEPVAKEARSSREDMVAAAQSYFDGIQNHDSSIMRGQKGCLRIENGVTTAGPVATSDPATTGPRVTGDCGEHLENFKTTIAAIDHRRYPVIDEEAGVVLGMVVFNRPPGAKRGNGTLYPRNLLTEIFVVEHGRVRGIYAAMHYLVPENPEAPGW
jgi:hypothetical protein